MSDTPGRRGHPARTILGIALAATMLTTAGAAAQSPSSAPPSPDSTTAPSRTRDRPVLRHRGFGHGMPWRGVVRRGLPRGGAGFRLGDRGLRIARHDTGVTVSSVEGTDLVLTTPDGWTRTIDTSTVVVTRQGERITATDVVVGESVGVVQTRNADGSYTVTGIEVQPEIVVGTVGTPSTDSFTVTGRDGTTTAVGVTAETQWAARGATAASIADATAGRRVAVEGWLQADGSIVATKVILG